LRGTLGVVIDGFCAARTSFVAPNFAPVFGLRSNCGKWLLVTVDYGENVRRIEAAKSAGSGGSVS
jgi:hypothetical protein